MPMTSAQDALRFPLDNPPLHSKLLTMFKRFILVMLLGGACLPSGASPLHQAVSARDIATLEELLESHVGSALDAVIGNGVTPLHLAAATDQADIAALLISRGADTGATNSLGFTPLHWAASRNGVEAMRVIIKGGADINAKARNNITPLHWAATKNAAAAVTLLVEAGADISATTAMGYTPLHLALRNNPYCDSAVLLAQARANQEDAAGILPRNSAATGVSDPAAPEKTAPGALPDAPEPAMDPVTPGMFLSIPIGLGDALSFVWMPQTKVWFGKHEISNNRFRRFDPLHSSRRIEGITLDDPEQPAVYVSWNDAMAFCAWLTTNFTDRIPAGYVFRLPTEAEWMIAAGAGAIRTYPWGNEWPPTYGNFSDQTARGSFSQWRGIEGYNDGYAATAPIEAAGMNELGIFGMAGNVWEWTLDWLDDAKPEYKIRKGGSWDFDGQESLRINARGLDRPDARCDAIGFRLVVAPAKD